MHIKIELRGFENEKELIDIALNRIEIALDDLNYEIEDDLTSAPKDKVFGMNSKDVSEYLAVEGGYVVNYDSGKQIYKDEYNETIYS